MTTGTSLVAQTPSEFAAAETSFRVGMDGIRDPYVEAKRLTECVEIAARLGPLAGRARHELLRFLLDNGIYRKKLGRDWTRLVGTLAIDATALDAVGLCDLMKGPNPYAVVAACGVIAMRHEALADQRSWIVDRLREFLTERWEEFHWRWTVEEREFDMSISPDTVRWMHTHASLALAKYEPDDPLTVLGYCQQLYEDDLAVRVQAARRLAKLRDPDAAEWLLDAAKLGPSEFSVAALAAVERIGPSVRHHARVLAMFEEDQDDAVRATAERVYRVLLDDLEVPTIEPSYEMVGNYDPAERGLSLEGETDRLVRWLDRDAGANREALLFDPRHIDRFTELTPEQGGPLNARMRWLPVRVQRDGYAPGYWGPTVALPLGGVDAAPHGVIGKDRERLRKDPFVIELIPVDREDPRLVHPDSATLFRVGASRWGSVVVRFEPAAARADARRLERIQFGRARGHYLHVVDGLVVNLERAELHPGGLSALYVPYRNGAAAHFEALWKLGR